MSTNWILGADGEPQRCDDMMTFAKWFATADRRVARDDISDDVYVSTVFLGIDHQFGRGLPLLYETLVFGGPNGGGGDRYTTRDEALAGHARFVAEERAR